MLNKFRSVRSLGHFLKMSLSTQKQYVPATLPQGEIVGVKSTSIYDEEYVSFFEIPYAQPPVGELRFKAPLPADCWEGVRDCTETTKKPVQKDILTQRVFGTEDCLYLNVYVKTLQSPKKLPVMIYIYGGGYENGFADLRRCNPDYFMSRSIVLVTFNYRLAAIGFLSLNSPELDVPGNAGLKDMVLAIKWVKENISHLNGDPDNITLFGNSAGSGATHIMMTTHQTKNLFHKAILQSGCMLNPWADVPTEGMALRLACTLGYEGPDNEAEILAYLRKQPAHKLVDVNLLTDDDRDYGILYPYGPIIEPYDSEHCIIAQPYVNALQTAWGNEIPLILGGTSSEGLVCYLLFRNLPHKFELFQNNPDKLLPLDVQKTTQNPQEREKMVKTILNAHFKGEKFNMDNLLEFLDIFSYRYFWIGMFDFLDIRLQNSLAAPTYLYHFDFDSETFAFRRFLYTKREVSKGVSHADDLNYLFRYAEAWRLDEDTPEYRTIQRMIGLWTSFAATSIPTIVDCEGDEQLVWPSISKENLYRCLEIGKTLEVRELPQKEKIEIWRNLKQMAEL